MALSIITGCADTPGSRFARQAWLLAVGLVVGQAILFAWNLERTYQRNLKVEYARLADAARIADENITGSLRAIDLLLQDVSEENDHLDIDIDAMTHYMTTRARAFPEVIAVMVTNAEGIITKTTWHNALSLDVHNRPYFTKSREDNTIKTLFSPLTLTKITNRNVIFATHSLTARNGQFSGIAITTLEIKFFHTLLASIRPDESGIIIALIGKDGRIISRAPDPERFVGFEVSKGGVFEHHVSTGQKLTFQRSTSLTDHIDKIYALRTIADGSFVVLVAKPITEALASWRAEAIIQGVILCVLSVAVLMLTYFAIRRHSGEAHARELAEATQDALRISEQKFTRIFNQAPIGAAIVSLDNYYLRVNLELERITGYSEINLLTRTVTEITHPDDRTVSIDTAQRIINGEVEQVEEIKRYIRSDGSVIWCQVSIRLIRSDSGTPLYFIPMSIDITDRRLSEQSLALTTSHLNMIMENVPAGIVLLKPTDGDITDFHIIAVNNNINKVAGFTKQFLRSGHSLVECLRPAAASGMYGDCDIERRIAERMKWYASCPNEIISSIFPSVGGRFVKATRSPHTALGFVAVTVDITDEVRVERELTDVKERFSLFMDTLPAAVFIKNNDVTTIYINKYMDTFIGDTSWIGKTVFEIFPPDAAAKMHADDQRALVAGYVVTEEEVPNADGQIRVFETHKFRINRQGQPPFLGGIALDITARKRAEEELRAVQLALVKAEKMSALGRLVAGVAHEINTPLGVSLTMATHILDQAVQFKAQCAEGGVRRTDLERFLADTTEGGSLLVSNVKRAADLVLGFKQITADQTSDERRVFNLKAWLDEFVFSLGPTWRISGHLFEVDCPPNLTIESYPGVLAQILSNFVMNSLTHAYPHAQHGTLSISIMDLNPENFTLIYADDGNGIPHEDCERVFEPFFTTRRGTGNAGLGLHIVFNLVTGVLGGSVACDSNTQRGTQFILKLPYKAEAQPGITA